jgi:uncharacterized SAM-binding protein YcdF (DUF218 family)
VLSAVATVLLVPPVNLVVAALAGMALARRWPVAGRRLMFWSLLALLLLSLPIVHDLLLAGLEANLAATGAQPPQAIVILGAEVADDGPRLDDIAVGPLTLERLRGGAALARARGLPILVTGGRVSDAGPPVAVLMARSLADDFAVPARWVEPDSATTWENAADSAKILRGADIGAVLVVTHAWHMRRALIAFRAAGLIAVPAPLLAQHALHVGLGSFVPRISAWQRSYFALHEWIGCAWYALLAR